MNLKDYQLRCCACNEPFNAMYNTELQEFDRLCKVCEAEALGMTDINSDQSDLQEFVEVAEYQKQLDMFDNWEE
jgi:hypothetical protein